ncbi:S8 family peptidase [Cellulophaga sp. F20128]|uniref:S8 family serine peptidase n=1 Tax=Cellulophaga sp. F20128 TaxID=2926413 RepID=UPI001FF55051|nr:S8 family serine peptidase [Cellulophaga sp. F20128]MCK0157664.1 S8 family peptidase [Cellulophaga sp. F20128]
MKKTLVLAAFLMMSIIGASQTSDYYYYKSKKVNLNKINTRQYILTKLGKRLNEIEFKLGQDGFALEKIIPNNVKETFSKSRKSNEYGNWAIIKGERTLENYDWIIYKAPFFKTEDNIEVGLSHLFYVKLKNEKDKEILYQIAKKKNVEVLGHNEFMPLWYTLACSKDSEGNALQMANYFFETGKFSASEPDILVDDIMLNPNYPNQWGLNNTGQYNGTSGIDINAPQAWSISTGQPDIVVAVIDHGVELNHPDLLNISPISFDTESNTAPSVVLGDHGTACAGIIGASDNSIGIVGVAPDCTLMSISNGLVLDINVRQELANGLNFAWQNGASVISNSWGSNALQSQLIDDAITNALNQGRNGLGCVVVFATGNDDGNVSYPANSNPEILAVGAISQCGERKSPSSCDGENTWGSNFGTDLDIVAPGVLIPTTDRQGNNGYNPNIPIHTNNGGNLVLTDYANTDYTTWFNGTSSATPHVAGVAALILSVNSNLTVEEVNDIIESTARKVGGYNYSTTTGRPNGKWDDEMGYGLLDAHAALQKAEFKINGENVFCPSATFSISPTPNNTNTINWSVSPSNAGTFSSNGTVTVFNRSGSFTGNATISAQIIGQSTYIVQKLIKIGIDENNIAIGNVPSSIPVNTPIEAVAGYPPMFHCDLLDVEWRYMPNSTIMNGSFSCLSNNNSQKRIIFHSPGTYNIQAKVKTSCGWSNWSGPVAINVTSGGYYYSVYPNPASSDIFVSEIQSERSQNTNLTSKDLPTNIKLELYNFTGNKVRNLDLDSNKTKESKLDVSSLAKGNYFLRIVSKEVDEVHQILIE